MQQLAVRPHQMGPDTGPPSATGRRRLSPRLLVAVAIALLLAAGITYRATSAAFTASTSTGTNTFTAGTVTLTDDDAGVALFTVSGLTPGNSGSRCITVNYTGNSAAAIKLYGATTGTLGTHLDLVVQESTTATPPDCSTFTTGTTIVTGVMSTILGTYNNYATGAGTWTVSGPTNRSYRVTYTLPTGASSTAQGTSANMTLTWEAQNT